MRTILDIEPLVRSQQELMDGGYSDHRIREAKRNGSLIKIRPGIFLSQENLESLKPWEHYSVEVLAFSKAMQQTVFSHQSAAILHGLALIKTHEQKVHIYRGKSSRGSAPGVVRHIKLTDSTAIVKTETGALATDIPTTLLDCAQSMAFSEAMVVLESALYQRKISLPKAQEHLFQYSGRNKHRVHKVALAMGDQSESPGETLTKNRLDALGIGYIQQYEVHLGGRIYRADFYLPDYGVFIEFDGAIKYQDYFASSSHSIQQERARERQFLNSGVRIFRTTWNEVFTRPHLFEAQLLAFLK